MVIFLFLFMEIEQTTKPPPPLKKLINSEKTRDRRPVTGHNARKDPTTPDDQSDGGTMTEAEILGLIRRV
ncbi:hypothetical protein, partial [Escherichia coli]|uniref:hypothetical protein n=1 Tax=Escherichia coli TaxID=562 RepID=UPI00201DCFC3